MFTVEALETSKVELGHRGGIHPVDATPGGCDVSVTEFSRSGVPVLSQKVQ